MKLHLLSILVTYLLIATPLQAEVYKWVDDKGVTHFGDKPPSGAQSNQKAAKVKLRGKNFYSHVKQLVPIKYAGKKKPQLVVFDELLLKLKNANRKDLEVGTRTTSRGSTCGSPRPIIWSDGYVRISENEMMGDVIVAFKDEGYRMTTGNVVNVSNTASRLVLTGTINRIRLEICDGNQRSGDRYYQKAAAYMQISWKLADRLTRKVIYQGISEGAENAFDRFKLDGATKAINRALTMSARNLLADKLFIEKLSPAIGADLKAESFDAMSIALKYGKANSSFKKRIANLKSSAVTIKTPGGHGSGVILDKAGYILTNAHVVGENTEVIVVVNDLELSGNVIRHEPQRDVALIKVQRLSTANGVMISNNKPTEGDTLYVIGTPLDESLSSTVTKGVYSAYRNKNGQGYYQTDAAINPGNSGGPVFDEKGELVAISVAGVFTHSGASLNVNYLIPIEAAINSLNLKKQRDVSHLFDVGNKSKKPENDDTVQEEQKNTAPEKTAPRKKDLSVKPALNEKNKVNHQATDMYLKALELKRKDDFEGARATLQRALKLTREEQQEYEIIRDELFIELPLAEAYFALRQYDEIRVNSLIEPVIGFLKNHPKRIVYMKRVEELRSGLKSLKQSKNAEAKDKANTIKHLMKKHLALKGYYPRGKGQLNIFLQQYKEITQAIEIRSYKSDGNTYQMKIFDKNSKSFHFLNG